MFNIDFDFDYFHRLMLESACLLVGKKTLQRIQMMIALYAVDDDGDNIIYRL